jgi:glutamate-1-semialdehyde 2,1-aminomutase
MGNEDLFEEAKKYIPGGVNSPVRACKAVGATPIFISKAEGSKIYDAEGKEYIDYVGSWGPMILGHAHPQVVEAVKAAAEKGTSYGASTEAEIEMARMIVDAFPSIEMVRMCSSGTEATMSAIRLARGYTGREKIVKFVGCYHGHADSLLVRAGSGVATLGIPGSPGVPVKLAELTISLPFNNLNRFLSTLDRYGKEIACVIVEPVAGNMGVVPPAPGFLEGLRTLTQKRGILLIFDEVITGFRLTYGGYQTLANITPDLTCLGKIIGGGLPVGAFGGSKTVMEALAPLGPVYQAGTLSGNPLAMAAGIATLKALRDGAYYSALDQRTSELCKSLTSLFAEKGVPVALNRQGSMFTLFFTPHPVRDFQSALKSKKRRYAHYFREMLHNGINLAPSQFEASFLSIAHSDDDIERTMEAARRTAENIKEGREKSEE